MRHEKKIQPQWFQLMLDGKKTYELRLGDWECKEGDTLVLREWDPDAQAYTGREIEKIVTHVGRFTTDKLYWPKSDIEKYGLQIISFH